jgi:hypothetical protein
MAFLPDFEEKTSLSSQDDSLPPRERAKWEDSSPTRQRGSVVAANRRSFGEKTAAARVCPIAGDLVRTASPRSRVGLGSVRRLIRGIEQSLRRVRPRMAGMLGKSA